MRRRAVKRRAKPKLPAAPAPSQQTFEVKINVNADAALKKLGEIEAAAKRVEESTPSFRARQTVTRGGSDENRTTAAHVAWTKEPVVGLGGLPSAKTVTDVVGQAADFSDPATDFSPLLDRVIQEARLHGVAAWLERHGAKLFVDGSVPTIALVDHADAQRSRISDAKKRVLDQLREIIGKQSERTRKAQQEALKNEVAIGVRHAEEFAKLREARALVDSQLSSSHLAIHRLDKRLSMALRTIDRMRANAKRRRKR